MLISGQLPPGETCDWNGQPVFWSAAGIPTGVPGGPTGQPTNCEQPTCIPIRNPESDRCSGPSFMSRDVQRLKRWQPTMSTPAAESSPMYSAQTAAWMFHQVDRLPCPSVAVILNGGLQPSSTPTSSMKTINTQADSESK